MAIVELRDAAGVLAGLSAEDAALAAAALRDGKVVVDDARYVVDGKATVRIVEIVMVAPGVGEGGKGRTLSAPAYALPHRPAAPIAMMTPATATRLGSWRHPS